METQVYPPECDRTTGVTINIWNLESSWKPRSRQPQQVVHESETMFLHYLKKKNFFKKLFDRESQNAKQCIQFIYFVKGFASSSSLMSLFRLSNWIFFPRVENKIQKQHKYTNKYIYQIKTNTLSDQKSHQALTETWELDTPTLHSLASDDKHVYVSWQQLRPLASQQKSVCWILNKLKQI